ncbi:TetR family transcriptional regulator (plasmid) [Fulvitalea axinellae]|uniref:TetR family transcriptional regulator n=1 Tax=Fulvitalea axinellae TaxID=1182444 RepID=A0AAU9CLH5_9BACT|nr:TetR family transcriptional regulator [Fulvitalea axinellae]
MQHLLSKISIHVNESVHLKNPESSDLGKKILRGSIELIDEMGFESFTFRKLAKAIGSTEASVYRYFESKHKLLLYLTSWYWGWMEYRLAFGLANVESPEEKLLRALDLLTESATATDCFPHIDESKLHRIVVAESAKAYLTKAVDHENSEGAFAGYKSFVSRVSDIVLEINVGYKYPHMLVSTVIEGAHHQRYFMEHLPRLTDMVEGEDSVRMFYRKMVFSAIRKEEK